MPPSLTAQDAFPNCVPYNRLKPGDSLNPYREFFAPSINVAVLMCRGMSLATKAVWILLAHEVYEHGWTELGERPMARLLHVHRLSLRRHLAKLRKLGLLRLHHAAGKVHGWQLVYQEIFRTCRPNLGGSKITTTPGSKITTTEVAKLLPHLCIKDFSDYGETIPEVGDQLTRNGVAHVNLPGSLNRTESTGFIATPSPTSAYRSPKSTQKHAPPPRESTVKGTKRHLQPVTLDSLLNLFEPGQNQHKPKAHTHAMNHTSVEEQTKTTDAKPKPPKPKNPIP